MNIYEANQQWSSRPADQRFENFADLREAVYSRANRARQEDVTIEPGTLQAEVIDITPTQKSLALVHGNNVLQPTHWSFGQLASRLGGPADYFRKISPEMAVKNLNYLIDRKNNGDEEKAVKLLTIDSLEDGVPDILQATTGQGYGRIFDFECVDACGELLDKYPEFDNPKDWSGKKSGLYASRDYRDCFMFFVDGGSIVDGGGERDQLHRGFYMGNSEVGAMSFFMATFFFRYVCGNHIIWNAENVKKVSIRHTISAPSRFVNEAIPTMKALTESSVQGMEQLIRKAKDYEFVGGKEKVLEFLKEKGFTAAEAKRGYETAEVEESKCSNLWEVIQGLTASARTVAFVDARLAAEKKASDLLKLVA